jgi:hypothetical protein
MSDKKPRGVVGRLLQKIKGGKTTTPPPTPKGPKDPAKAMTLFTRLRDAGMVAERDSLSLDGTLPARRKAIVAELEADRYEQAEQLLEALNVDYEKERVEQKRAAEQLKLEFGGIKQRAVAAANTKSTSPVIADAIRKANKVEQAITDNIKAKEVILAARLLASYDQAVKTVAQLEALDIESFKVEWLKVDTELCKLTAPVIGPDVTKVRNDEVTPAKNKADGGDAFAGLQFLAKALLSCQRVALLLQAYDKALLDAQNLLNARKAQILPLDVEQIQKDLIDAAKDKAKLGQRQAALDLLSKVAARCGTAKTDRDIAPSWKADLEQEMTALLSHAQRAALAKDIEALNARFERAKANQALALTKAGNALYSEIYWECKRLTQLATAHGDYVQLRDSDVKPKVHALRTDEPTSAVTPLEAEIKAAEDALARAERKADKHQYEMAKETLVQLKTQCATVAQLKRDQAAYAVLHKDVVDLLGQLPDAKGTTFEAPFAALRARLTQAEQQAVTQRQFVQATQALTALKADVQSALAMSNGSKEAETAVTQAKPTGDSAEALRTSLEKVRQLLEKLKLHPGHPGAKVQIDQMTTLLQQAEEALKD